jgi:hypothetical protein
VKDKRKWLNMKRNLRNGARQELKIGFFREDSYGAENNNLPVATVAAWQDKGAPFVGEQHIPARPFMSVGLKNLLKSPVYTNKYKQSFLSVLERNSNFSTEYHKLSIAVVPNLQKIIDKWALPPNAPDTIRKKGFNNPLIETRKMRDSVKAKVSDRV